MKTALLLGLALIAPTAAFAQVQGDNKSMTTGHFEPTMDSLKQYTCPKWFRDAKFGIWAHWGPQAVPMDLERGSQNTEKP